MIQIIALGLLFAHADHLTVYSYPAPTAIDWSSPKGLAWSAANSDSTVDDQLKNIHTIGHMNFDLSCDDGTHLVTGQTNSDNSEMGSKIFKEGYGLGAFLTNYSGRFETQDEIEMDLPVRYQRGSIAFMDFQISKKTCERTKQFVLAYQALHYDKVYGGLQMRPRWAEGGGCAAVTESVMEVAGLMTRELLQYFSHSIWVPTNLIGGVITGKFISPMTILFGAQAWNTTPKNSYPLSFVDPYKAYSWVQYAHTKKLKLTGMTYELQKRGFANGVLVDATQIQTPTEPFFNSGPLSH